MEKNFYVVVKNKNTERCVGLLKVGNTCYFDDYRTNEWDVELGDSREEVEQILIDYLVKDLPCNPQDVQFMSEYKFYSYIEDKITKMGKKFCADFNLTWCNSFDIDDEGIELEIEVAGNTLSLSDDMDYLLDCKNDDDFYNEIAGMFCDTIDYFVNKEDLINKEEIVAKSKAVRFRGTKWAEIK